MKETNTTSVEMPGGPDFPKNGLLGVAGSFVGAISGLALWHFGTGNYEVFGQFLTIFNTHLLIFHIGRYAGFAEYRDRFARRARFIFGGRNS